LKIDPPAERFLVSLAQRRRLRRMSFCLFYLNRSFDPEALDG
jgi:hypothetical protein